MAHIFTDEYRYVHNKPYPIDARISFPAYVSWGGEYPREGDIISRLKNHLKEYEEAYGMTSLEFWEKIQAKNLPEYKIGYPIGFWKSIVLCFKITSRPL